MINKRVLVIDDDPELCEEIVDILKDAGYDATCISDPRKGLSLIEEDTHDVVLLDYKMPGLTGVEVLKNIKRKNLSARIFMVSGRPFLERLIEDENLSGMVAAFIPKPINFDMLFQKLKQTM